MDLPESGREATEYLEDCVVIRNGQKPSFCFDLLETLIIDGFELEADLTSEAQLICRTISRIR